MIAAKLLEYGVEVDVLDNYLSVETLQTLKLKGYVLENFESTENGVVYIRMPREIITKYGVTDEEA